MSDSTTSSACLAFELKSVATHHTTGSLAPGTGADGLTTNTSATVFSFRTALRFESNQTESKSIQPIQIKSKRNSNRTDSNRIIRLDSAGALSLAARGSLGGGKSVCRTCIPLPET